MPQIFQVLRCYKCLVFQVHQTKKSNKWECKMCGEKQSVKRHYGIGTPKDCRLHVQKLNGIRGEVKESKQNGIDTDDEFENDKSKVNVLETQFKQKSRWSNYVEAPGTISPIDNNSPMFLNDTEVVLELPQKRKSTLGNHYKKKVTKSLPLNEESDEMVQNSAKEDFLSSLQKSELESNNVKKNIIKCNQHIENIDSIKQTDKAVKYLCSSGSYKLENTLSLEFSYSSVKNEGDVSRQIVKKFKLPTMNKNSKWAQFADEEQQEETTEEIENPTSPCVEQLSEECDDRDEGMENLFATCIEPSQKKSGLMFALCDDSDLDNVLDI